MTFQLHHQHHHRVDNYDDESESDQRNDSTPLSPQPPPRYARYRRRSTPATTLSSFSYSRPSATTPPSTPANRRNNRPNHSHSSLARTVLDFLSGNNDYRLQYLPQDIIDWLWLQVKRAKIRQEEEHYDYSYSRCFSSSISSTAEGGQGHYYCRRCEYSFWTTWQAQIVLVCVCAALISGLSRCSCSLNWFFFFVSVAAFVLTGQIFWILLKWLVYVRDDRQIDQFVVFCSTWLRRVRRELEKVLKRRDALTYVMTYSVLVAAPTGFTYVQFVIRYNIRHFRAQLLMEAAERLGDSVEKKSSRSLLSKENHYTHKNSPHHDHDLELHRSHTEDSTKDATKTAAPSITPSVINRNSNIITRTRTQSPPSSSPSSSSSPTRKSDWRKRVHRAQDRPSSFFLTTNTQNHTHPLRRAKSAADDDNDDYAAYDMPVEMDLNGILMEYDDP